MMVTSFNLLIILGLSFTCSTSVTFLAETKYPCAFIDTMNISGNIKQEIYENISNFFSHDNDNGNDNGNDNDNDNNNDNGDFDGEENDFNHKKNYYINTIIDGDNSTNNNNYKNKNKNNWISIPRELIGVYDFIIQNGNRIPVKRHLRACICKIKPCIRFCCKQNYYYDLTNQTCIAISNINDYTLDQTIMNVRKQNGSDYRMSIGKNFNIQYGSLWCERMRYILSDSKEYIQWTLFENGTIVYNHHYFKKHYCFTPYRLQNMTWIWQPLVCTTDKLPFILGVREWTYAVCLILATICMAIIFFMHLFCTEMRNTFYGIAIEAYSLCIIIGYSMKIHLVLTDPLKMTKTSCDFIPCFILLFLLLSFYILTFVSFNFYLNFHGIVLTKSMFWLIFFPIASLAVGWSLYVGFEKYDGKPIFGGDTCWFDPRNWTIMIYFNAPILVACSVSVFFYILTLISIREDQESSGSKNLSFTLEENRFNAFWQFFSYTFITWLVCVISFVINYYSVIRTHINYAVCLIIILHGFGSLFALIGKNQQIQIFLRRLEDGIDEDDEEVCDNALPMSGLRRN